MDKEIKELTMRQNILLFVISWIMIIGGRILSMFFKPLVSHINYGQMTTFYVEIINCFIWILCILILCAGYKKKCGVNILSNPLTRGQELETKNLIAVIAVIVACIFVISAQIGFQVKPFYDMGVKFTGYEFMGNIGGILRNAIKCVWMLIIIESSQKICEAFSGKVNIPWGGIVLMCTMGVYDIVYNMTTLVITYLLLNVVFGTIYLLTHKSISKTYFCILLIYLF